MTVVTGALVVGVEELVGGWVTSVGAGAGVVVPADWAAVVGGAGVVVDGAGALVVGAASPKDTSLQA
ncbi:MAG: hypothetical protein R2749_00940 [Acidimicrobiales bacterium]